MADYVRVKDRETGHHVSILRSLFDHEGEVWEELDQPAADAGGAPLPPKYHTSVSNEAAKNEASQPAANTEGT